MFYKYRDKCGNYNALIVALISVWTYYDIVSTSKYIVRGYTVFLCVVGYRVSLPVYEWFNKIAYTGNAVKGTSSCTT